MAPAAVSMVVAAVGAAMTRFVTGPLLLGVVAVEPGENCGESEEDTVHDAECEAGLEHSAGFVRADLEASDMGGPEDPETDVPCGARDDVATVGASDEPQVVYSGDKGAEEAEVDQPNETRIGAAPMVAEECEQRPDEAQHRNDKEDKDVIRRQDVVGGGGVHEVAQHAHGWNLAIGATGWSAFVASQVAPPSKRRNILVRVPGLPE